MLKDEMKNKVKLLISPSSCIPADGHGPPGVNLQCWKKWKDKWKAQWTERQVEPSSGGIHLWPCEPGPISLDFIAVHRKSPKSFEQQTWPSLSSKDHSVCCVEPTSDGARAESGRCQRRRLLTQMREESSLSWDGPGRDNTFNINFGGKRDIASEWVGCKGEWGRLLNILSVKCLWDVLAGKCEAV